MENIRYVKCHPLKVKINLFIDVVNLKIELLLVLRNGAYCYTSMEWSNYPITRHKGTYIEMELYAYK